MNKWMGKVSMYLQCCDLLEICIWSSSTVPGSQLPKSLAAIRAMGASFAVIFGFVSSVPENTSES